MAQKKIIKTIKSRVVKTNGAKNVTIEESDAEFDDNISGDEDDVDDDKANILVIGTSGAGKSTLINTVMGSEVAHVGMGKHCTEEMCAYESEELKLRLIDSRGFEYSNRNTKEAVRDMKTWMKGGLKGSKPRIHMLWFCVDATSKRFTRQTIHTLEEVKKEWKDVPIIVVLTKSFFVAEDEDNIKMVQDTFLKCAKHTGMPIAIVPVLSEAPKGENIAPRGIGQLLDVTMENIDEAVKSSEEAVNKYKLKIKRMQSHALVAGATTTAGVIGVIPTPDSIHDAALLTPLEVALINKIEKVYEMDPESDLTKNINKYIFEAGAISLAAKLIINKLKAIPQINIAADILNGIVAAVMVAGIGEGTIAVMEMIISGKVDTDDLDWVKEVVNEKSGAVISSIVGIIEKQNGKIDVSEIIGQLFKNLEIKKK